ncbi:MAG: SCP2 sterol-binding domain-containing protein [Thiomicrorhabdus chilensis]|uniref:ubiquinone biosynthesis accessory factor UbiJ n=1 Tax=Thiomicrorhabdus chilensis TaxID=63656 RepID=UPI00299EE422|nr:SCP2 sterol-binding domain-containing protein [Thiomicrorhabdus chilensis]MDX1347641.1 SCP2 sterol-binding domain-containing protein [Thiomicrorhabdus chilensis]
MILSQVFEFALNQAVRLDEQHGQVFQPLNDKVIALQLNDVNTTLYVLFTDYGISVQNALQGQADAKIETTLADLLAFAQTGLLKDATYQADQTLAETFVNALASVEIDWEEHLSHYTGDLIAFKIGHAARSIMQTKTAAKQQIGDTLKEYLQFELNALPTHSQVQRFGKQVLHTQKDVEALEKRIDALSQSLSSPPASPSK